MNRPRPVLTASAASGAATGIALVLAFLGYAQASKDVSGAAEGIGSAVAFLAPLLAHSAAGAVAQTKVTPSADPRNDNGEALVPESILHTLAVEPDEYWRNADTSDLEPATPPAAAAESSQLPPGP